VGPRGPALRQSSGLEDRLLGDGRAWATALAAGRTLEIGVGTGRNLSLYPAGVRLTGIDISPGCSPGRRPGRAASG
jgi:hypothetical protein